MPDVPRFSVTVPAYNAESTLEETIESVLAQAFDDWELVIVDDGSTDETRQIAERFAAADRRIRVISQENRGSGGAYNTAVRNARADLIVMLSADDLLLPDHLGSFDAFIAENPEASVFSSDGYYEYPDGSQERADVHPTRPGSESCTIEELLDACFFGVGAVYRREVFDAVGGFREDLYAEDYLFWLMALAQGFRHRYLDQPLAVHRRGDVQKSADAIRMRETDAIVVREVIASGLLTPAQLEAAKRAEARLQRNIRIRKAMTAVLGPKLTTRLVERLRGRREVGPGASSAQRIV
ncbi:MAG: glycosyltransferase [Coriobacteriales bacterium]|nr:glycosyltransferase [Coriobacteriales bacterium]